MGDVVTIGDATLYLGDCREILPTLPKVDAVVTDPPYPDYMAGEYGYDPETIFTLNNFDCKQYVFWSAKSEFPLSYTAIHIWHKRGNGVASMYERIFERHGGGSYRVFTDNSIINEVTARFARDEWWDHPSQKPIGLVTKLIALTVGTILDPFMGSGTTGVACERWGRRFVGIERERKYFDIACARIEAAYAQGRLFA